jgi:hypothetical protein
MTNPRLTLDELTEGVHTCESIEIEDCTPPYLGQFIAGRPAFRFPALASKMRHYDDEQMHRICGLIKATYALLR